MQVITLATPAMLPQARVLARSLRRHQPDWSHEVMLVGIDRAPPDAGDWPRMRSAADELDLDVDRLIVRHDPEDLLALLLPHALKTSSKRSAGPVLHLQPSVWVLGNLEPLGA